MESCGESWKLCGSSLRYSPNLLPRRMRARSNHRVASNSSSTSIFQLARRAITTAAASWSNPAIRSAWFCPSVHLLVMVVTRMRISPFSSCLRLRNCRKNCCCACCPCCAASAALAATSKYTATVVEASSPHIFQHVVPPSPTCVSATDWDFFSRGAQGPMTPATLTSRLHTTSNTPLLASPSAPSSPPLISSRLKLCLNTGCRKLSASTTIPPVRSIALFISASPTWSSAHANTSRVCPCRTSVRARPS
mmetsp:Transcript_54019/g.171419  ORF Transcript_54019/g.171419 Transcript_54019/m.171419 type:complete len:250 (+) Transcript_54019:681-1430(+)